MQDLFFSPTSTRAATIFALDAVAEDSPPATPTIEQEAWSCPSKYAVKTHAMGEGV